MSILISTLLTKAFALAGITAAGETPTAADMAFALSLLEDWTQLAGTQSKLKIGRQVLTSPTLSASKTFYTLGPVSTALPSPDIPTTLRPSRVDDAWFDLISSSGGQKVSYPLKPITADEYSLLTLKNLSSGIPGKIYVQPKPYGFDLYLYPLFGSVAQQPSLGLVVSNPILPTGLTLTTDLEPYLYPGLQGFLVFNFALFLADSYGKQITPGLAATAEAATAALKNSNSSPVVSQSGAQLIQSPRLGQGGGFDGRYLVDPKYL